MASILFRPQCVNSSLSCWCVFLRTQMAINKHCLMYWLGAEFGTNYCMKIWSIPWTHICTHQCLPNGCYSNDGWVSYVYLYSYWSLAVGVWEKSIKLENANWPDSQVPECTCSISHNAPFRTDTCKFLFWMEHFCSEWNRCILWGVKLFYSAFRNPMWKCDTF